MSYIDDNHDDEMHESYLKQKSKLTKKEQNPMLVKVMIPIQSHLSDALFEIEFEPEKVQTRIRFVKWLLNKFSDNLNVEVDINKEFKLFNN